MTLARVRHGRVEILSYGKTSVPFCFPGSAHKEVESVCITFMIQLVGCKKAHITKLLCSDHYLQKLISSGETGE